MRPRTPTLGFRLLLFVVLVAGTHAASVALIRPMFQVSDEISYFGAMQVEAARLAGNDSALRDRILPGDAPVHPLVSGKAAFRATAAAIFVAAARRAEPPDAAVLTRLAIALSHVAVTLATWYLARRLYPAHLEIAFTAALFTAWQPVLTAFDAAITPDAFANAASAWSLVSVAASLTGARRRGHLLVAAGLAALAFSMKDTAISTFAAVGVGTAVHLRQSIRTTRWFALALAAGATTLAVLAWSTGSRYIEATTMNLAVIERDPLGLTRALLLSVSSLGGYFKSFWAQFANFGGHDIFVSRAWSAAIALLCASAAAGWLRRGPGGVAPAPGSAWMALWAAVVVGIALHPLRVVALGGIDEPQGRWLFPAVAALMVALAVGLRDLCRSARGTTAVGAVTATAIGVLPLVIVAIPYFYVDVLHTVDAAHLFLRGTYGIGPDAEGALAFIGPVSPGLVQARVGSAWAVLALAALSVATGLGVSLSSPVPCPRPPSSSRVP